LLLLHLTSCSVEFVHNECCTLVINKWRSGYITGEWQTLYISCRI
jgi:hypothetical protein